MRQGFQEAVREMVPEGEARKAPSDIRVTDQWDENRPTDFEGFSGGTFPPEDSSE
jgi:hypothetical protein